MNKKAGSELSITLFSPARSSSSFWIVSYYTSIVKPIYRSYFGLLSRVEAIRDKPSQTLACGHAIESSNPL